MKLSIRDMNELIDHGIIAYNGKALSIDPKNKELSYTLIYKTLIYKLETATVNIKCRKLIANIRDSKQLSEVIMLSDILELYKELDILKYYDTNENKFTPSIIKVTNNTKTYLHGVRTMHTFRKYIKYYMRVGLAIDRYIEEISNTDLINSLTLLSINTNSVMAIRLTDLIQHRMKSLDSVNKIYKQIFIDDPISDLDNGIKRKLAIKKKKLAIIKNKLS